jgi:putative transposase
MKYAWIKRHSDSFPVALMCQLLGVSRSGYYDSIGRPPSPRAERSAKLRAAVRQVFEERHGIYGSFKIARELQEREDMESACRNTVAKAMQEMKLKSRVRKSFTPTTTKADPSKQPAPNLLSRDFTATGPNQKWVTDITYLRVQGGWIYLAVVLDLFSRKVVGWTIGDSLVTELVSEALRRAIESRRPARGKLLHHSDRGSQYTSDDYQKTLRTLGVRCSMSRTGDCYDNAVAERFFWSLKHEWTSHHEYADLESARQSVFKYIETFYNRQRLHQSLGYKTPDEFEALHAQASAV